MDIYILLTDTGTIFSKCIRFYTKDLHNHCSISMDIELERVYSFGRKNVANPFNSGFVKENMHNELLRQANCQIYCFSITRQQYLKLEQKIAEFERNKEKFRYNLLGVIGIVFKQKWIRPNTFFCSQFVAYLLEDIGISFQDKPSYFMTPNEIVSSLNLQLLYQGKLQDFLLSKNHLICN